MKRLGLIVLMVAVLAGCANRSDLSAGEDAAINSDTTVKDRQALIDACEAARQEHVHDSCPGAVDELLALFRGRGCDPESVVVFLRATFIVDMTEQINATSAARTPCITAATAPRTPSRS